MVRREGELLLRRSVASLASRFVFSLLPLGGFIFPLLQHETVGLGISTALTLPAALTVLLGLIWLSQYRLRFDEDGAYRFLRSKLR